MATLVQLSRFDEFVYDINSNYIKTPNCYLILILSKIWLFKIGFFLLQFQATSPFPPTGMCVMTLSLRPTTRWARSGSACLRQALSCGAAVWAWAVVILGVIHPVSAITQHALQTQHGIMQQFYAIKSIFIMNIHKLHINICILI